MIVQSIARSARRAAFNRRAVAATSSGNICNNRAIITPISHLHVHVGTQTSTPTRRDFSNDTTKSSPWAKFPQAPPDPIIGLTEVR
jgi:hypothetical protein